MSIEASKYITAVPREEANLEAEGGETVYGDINGDGMPEHKSIKGPRHSAGGVPLKLPDDTFIFSDTNSMKINDRENRSCPSRIARVHQQPNGLKATTNPPVNPLLFLT